MVDFVQGNVLASRSEQRATGGQPLVYDSATSIGQAALTLSAIQRVATLWLLHDRTPSTNMVFIIIYTSSYKELQLHYESPTQLT
jgi:hypothetical protein